MNEDLLGECRACGQMVSKNLVTRVGGFFTDGHRTYRETRPVEERIRVSSGCPHCGEAEPHLTEEEIEKRKTAEQRAIKEIETVTGHIAIDKRIFMEGCRLSAWLFVVLIGLCFVGFILSVFWR